MQENREAMEMIFSSLLLSYYNTVISLFMVKKEVFEWIRTGQIKK